MRKGAQGPDVEAIQRRLRELGMFREILPEPGVFDSVTDFAVRDFQAARKLVVDGDIGPTTNLALVDRVCPLRLLADDRAPVVTSRHAIHNASRSNHYGVDLFYPWRTGDPAMRIGDGGRTAKWWIPPGTMAIAGASGVVVNAGPSKTGYRLWIRIDGGQVAIGYFHLTGLTAAVKVGARIELGTALGEVGHNPSPAEDPIHLHFELYRGNVADDVRGGHYPRGTMDPERFLAGARVLAAA